MLLMPTGTSSAALLLAVAGCTCSNPGCGPTSTDRIESAARCPVVPLRLVVSAPGQDATLAPMLDARGDLRTGLTGPGKAVARLDPRGCLVGPDGVWVEVLPNGDVWTPREIIDLDGPLLRRPPASTLRITKGWAVETLSASGEVQSTPYGSLRFEGYRDEARCAAQVLLATFAGMTPGMAVVDGNAIRLPRPEGSNCGGL